MESKKEETARGAEKIMPYGSKEGNGAKGKQVEDMFDSIAPAYDLMNSLMTMGMHKIWRNRALKLALAMLRDSGGSPGRILDVASGTGDVVFALHKSLPEADITGVDLSQKMLDIAIEKAGRLKAGNANAFAGRKDGEIRFVKGDCLALPFADECFDMVTVAYGVRNFENALQGYREMLRVLRPGGVLCVIELCQPVSAPVLAGYKLYTRGLIPAAGRIVSGDSRAYSYLHESIEAAPQRDDMCALMREAGFVKASWRTYFPGVICAYIAQKKS